MPDVIDFMEKMGGDAQLSQASMDELTAALADWEITPEQRAVLLAGDAEQLGKLLGTLPVCLLVMPPDPPGPPPHCPVPPAIPPAPPGEADEGEDPADSSECDSVAASPPYRREPLRD